MSFGPGDILYFEKYQFTDTGREARHFGLVLVSETATKYQGSILCCVITSKKPGEWGFLLSNKKYPFFICDSFACFNRKDLVSKSGLSKDLQPRGSLDNEDFKRAFKLLKSSLFVVKDLANNPFLRGTIIYQWKRTLKSRRSTFST